MAVVDVKIDGADELLANIAAIEKSSTSIAKSVTYAGLRVFANASRDASPGTIKRETGLYVRESGGKVWGRAGLIRFPRKGDGQNGPHGVYLELGTKFITARRFIANAIHGAMARAQVAMQQAAERRVQRIADSK